MPSRQEELKNQKEGREYEPYSTNQAIFVRGFSCNILTTKNVLRMTGKEYNQCVEQFADRVYRFIVKNMRNNDDAQDVVQNAFEILWKNHENVLFEKSRSYLFTVAYHNMIDQFRKKKMDSEITDEHIQMQGNSYQFTGGKDAVELGLSKLSEIQKTVVLLRDYEGYSYEEVGKITGLTESQVKVYIFRARTQLKNFLVSSENAI